MRAASARDVAARVIERVLSDDAFASAALDAELSRAAQLDARDRALATELVYGSLRLSRWLHREINRFAPRGVRDPRVHAHLLVAAYQLFFTRVPAFAAVSDAVESVRAVRGERVAAFANAVLRKVSERAAKAGEGARDEAIAEAAPEWMRSALARALGEQGARAFVASGAEPPPIALRVERAEERGAWIDRLRASAAEASFEAGRVSPLAIVARGAGRPQRLAGWSEGAWSVQEEGSQLAALSVGAREGERVLDACAGRGNKTAVLARAVGATGGVDACDVSETKLARLRQELSRAGLAPRATFAVDWTVGSGDVRGEYERVLVDAPCTGIGTLRRRPEIALRREAADVESLARSQIAIVTRVSAHVRPGGALVYVVCSVLREEAEDVIDAFLRVRADFAPAPFDAPAARAVADDAPSFRLLPQAHGTDGYFVAMLRRRA